MSEPAADDFSFIKARLEEIRKEREAWEKQRAEEAEREGQATPGYLTMWGTQERVEIDVVNTEEF